MAGALRLVSHVIRPALTTAVVVVSTAHAAAPTVVPLECGITWTMVGKTIIVVPDCAHRCRRAAALSRTATRPRRAATAVSAGQSAVRQRWLATKVAA